MTLLSFNDLSFDIGDQPILRRAELALDAGERIALIGRNGAGKTTLLRLLASELKPDSGDIRHKRDLRVSRLDQTLPEALDVTVSDYVASGLASVQSFVDRYQDHAATATDAASMKKLEELHHRIDAEDGWDLPQRVESLLAEMGLPGEQPMRELSGGWRRRAALARALVSRPELLMLDEPTNHLDVSTIEWMEERLRGFTGALLFVTHDRAFLERLATRIVELDRAALTSWPGDYGNFLHRKEEALAVEARANAQFDKRLDEEEAWIRQGIKARRTRNEGRVRALEAMRAAYAARVGPEGKARVTIERAGSSGRRVIELEGVGHGFGSNSARDLLFEGVSMMILRGDRLGLVGNNGVGKTTMLRILLGELEPREGTVTRGVNLELAYFDQLRRDFDPAKSVAEVVADGREFVTINGKDRHIIGYLKGFLFSPERAVTKLAALSGGERNRVILARLFAKPSNLLVLDEPTNDLDLETLEVLEEQLVDYTGTLIVVSHDRAFLDNVVTSTLVFEEGGTVCRYVGGYTDWLRQGKKLAMKEGALRPRGSKPPAKAPDRSPPVTKKKRSYKQQLELDALPARIQKLEGTIAELEAQAAAPDFYTQPFTDVEPILNELAETKQALEKTMERWLELEG
jgi:ATP-binding cassette subfamily F protein uup